MGMNGHSESVDKHYKDNQKYPGDFEQDGFDFSQESKDSLVGLNVV